MLVLMMSKATDIALLKYSGAGCFDDGVSGNQGSSVDGLGEN